MVDAILTTVVFGAVLDVDWQNVVKIRKFLLKRNILT